MTPTVLTLPPRPSTVRESVLDAVGDTPLIELARLARDPRHLDSQVDVAGYASTCSSTRATCSAERPQPSRI